MCEPDIGQILISSRMLNLLVFGLKLDAEMKRLQAKGIGSVHKKAEAFTMDEEEQLWEKKILGDHSPETLLNTIIYMNGLYFALRSGSEHRNLRHNPCQIKIVERPGERPHLLYTEDISKNHPSRNQRPESKTKSGISSRQHRERK